MNLIDAFMHSLKQQSFKKNDWVGKIDFELIPPGKKDELFKTVEGLKDTESIGHILSFLFDEVKSTRDKLRILDIGIRSSVFSLEKKRKFLEYYRYFLDKESANPSVDNIKGYWIDYKVLSAMLESQIGNLEKAINLGKEAIQGYEEIGELNRSQKVKEIVDEWELQRQGDRFIIPIDNLVTERMILKQEIEQYQRDLESLRTRFQVTKFDIENEVKELEHQRQILNDEISQLRIQVNQLHTQSLTLREEISSQQKTLERNKPYLEALEVLPHLIESPLWVEIARLALIQGEVDELVWRAFGRLLSINQKLGQTELRELVLRGVKSGFELDFSVLKTYLPFVEEINRISEIVSSNPEIAAELICKAWETMLCKTEEWVV